MLTQKEQARPKAGMESRTEGDYVRIVQPPG